MNAGGIRFGRYRLLERVALGGMAELYRAQLTGPSGFSKTVAIKKILADLSRHSRFRKMFLHEARIMAALSHRNLVQVFELGEVSGELFLCLEFVSGCDLARVLRKHRAEGRFLEPSLAAWVAREICRGLEYMHNLTDDEGLPLHIIHRDVNPHNVLLSRHGDVKLSDFGIAKSIVQEVRTSVGQVMGKLQYLSPEQARGDTASPQSDLYSVGLILYEMLGLERYIQGDDERQLLSNASHPFWRPIVGTNPPVPDSLQRIVERSLRADADKRFASAKAFAQALTRFLQSAERAPGSADLARLVASVHQAPKDEAHRSPVAKPAAATDREPRAGRPEIPLAPPMPAAPQTVSLPGRAAGDTPGGKRPERRRRRGALLGIAAVALAAGAAWFVAFGQWPPVDRRLGTESEAERVADHAPTTRSAARTTAVPTAEPSSTPPQKAKPAKTDFSRQPARPSRKRQGRVGTKQRLGVKQNRSAASTPHRRAEPIESSAAEKNAVQATKALGSLRGELGRQRDRLRKRGVLPRDCPHMDRLIAEVERLIRKGEVQRAQMNLGTLDREVDRLVIDRRFVEGKILRLQKSLARRKLESRFSATIRQILDHVINNRFEEANAAINSVFGQLGGA